MTRYSMEAHASHGTPQASIQADWETREFIETITAGIKRIAEFLNNFGAYAVIVGMLYACEDGQSVLTCVLCCTHHPSHAHRRVDAVQTGTAAREVDGSREEA